MDALAGWGQTAWFSELVLGGRKSRELCLGGGCTHLSSGNLCNKCLRDCIPHSLAEAPSRRTKRANLVYHEARLLVPVKSYIHCRWQQVVAELDVASTSSPMLKKSDKLSFGRVKPQI